MISSSQEIKAIICGCIHRETIINLVNQVFLDQLGGSLAYAAAGFHLWTENPGLVARISKDTPLELISQFEQRGMNSGGVHKNDFNHEMRAFYRVLDQDQLDTENPIKYFSLLNKPIPKQLLGYVTLPFIVEKRNTISPVTLLPEHIPVSFLNSPSALLCSVDFVSLSVLLPFLRMNGIKTLLIKPSKGTMVSTFWRDIPTLIRGCTGLICSRKEAKNLFLGKSENLHEIAETLANFGLEFVVITCGKEGQHLFVRSTHTHWEIPAYPVNVIDSVHASDAFSGGFLADFLKSFDPLQATYHGNISASIKLEGSGAFYLLDALPELVKARLNHLQANAKKV